MRLRRGTPPRPALAGLTAAVVVGGGAMLWYDGPASLRPPFPPVAVRATSSAPVVAAAPAEPAPAGRRVRMGRNRLDLDMRRLFGPDGREVPLVASEFELLRAFAERPGRTLSRETLLDLAHPHGEDHFDRSIDVRIARIRRKIEVEPSHPTVIRTARGLGYVFDPDAES